MRTTARLDLRRTAEQESSLPAAYRPPRRGSSVPARLANAKSRVAVSRGSVEANGLYGMDESKGYLAHCGVTSRPVNGASGGGRPVDTDQDTRMGYRSGHLHLLTRSLRTIGTSAVLVDEFADGLLPLSVPHPARVRAHGVYHVCDGQDHDEPPHDCG